MRELQLTKLIDLFGILRLFHLTLILVSFSVQLMYLSCTSMYSKYVTSVRSTNNINNYLDI